MRRGINQHTVEKICKSEPVHAGNLAECLRVLEEYETENTSSEDNLPQKSFAVLIALFRLTYPFSRVNLQKSKRYRLIVTMSCQLDGARSKIERAQEHLQTLRAELKTYLAARPWKIGTKTILGRTIPDFCVASPPPVKLSLLIGDCIANSRAALDYVMWELALRYFS